MYFTYVIWFNIFYFLYIDTQWRTYFVKAWDLKTCLKCKAFYLVFLCTMAWWWLRVSKSKLVALLYVIICVTDGGIKEYVLIWETMGMNCLKKEKLFNSLKILNFGSSSSHILHSHNIIAVWLPCVTYGRFRFSDNLFCLRCLWFPSVIPNDNLHDILNMPRPLNCIYLPVYFM